MRLRGSGRRDHHLEGRKLGEASAPHRKTALIAEIEIETTTKPPAFSRNSVFIVEISGNQVRQPHGNIIRVILGNLFPLTH